MYYTRMCYTTSVNIRMYYTNNVHTYTCTTDCRCPANTRDMAVFIAHLGVCVCVCVFESTAPTQAT